MNATTETVDLTEIDSSGTVPPYLALLNLLWDRRGFLGKSAAIGLVVSALIAFTIPRRYTTTVRLMPPEPLSASSSTLAAFAANNLPSALVNQAGSLLGTKTPGALFVGILGSDSVEDDLINQFDLRKEYHRKTYADARKKLASLSSFEEDKKDGIITISVTDTDPGRARDLAEAYISELNKLVAQMSTSSARRERVFLEDRLKSVKLDLDAASLDLGKFSSHNATLDPESQGRAALDSTGRLESELALAETELQGLRASYSEDNYRVQSAEARTSELRAQLQKMSGTGDEDGTALRPGELYPPVRKLPLLDTTYMDLYRKVKIEEGLYEMLSKQYEVAKVEEAKAIPTVAVLDPPRVPEKKSFPPRLALMIAGCFLAAVLAAAWIWTEDTYSRLSDSDPRRQFLTRMWRGMAASFSRPGAAGNKSQ